MNSDFDPTAALLGGDAAVVDELALDGSGDGSGDGTSDNVSVLSHVEALINACFPESTPNSGSEVDDTCVPDAEEPKDVQQMPTTGAAEPLNAGEKSSALESSKELPREEHERIAETDGEAASSLKRKYTDEDNRRVESEHGYAPEADLKQPEPCSKEVVLPTAAATPSAERSHENLSTAEGNQRPATTLVPNHLLDLARLSDRNAISPQNPMVREVTRFLLDRVKENATNSKLELRQTLKADLERCKRDLSLKDRSKMRSRREAAVSREGRVAYTKGLEELVFDLVRGNMLLLAERSIAINRDPRHAGNAVDTHAPELSPPLLAPAQSTVKPISQSADVSPSVNSRGGGREDSQEIVVASSANFKDAIGRHRK